MENNFIYLDNASTTPLSENVLNVINSTYKNYWHNPSSTYELGIKCSTYLEKIRSIQFAELAGTPNFFAFWNARAYSREQTMHKRPTTGVMYPRPRNISNIE